MSIVTAYLKQSATWKRRTGYDAHGQPTTSASVINVRWEWKQRLIRNAEGQEIASQGRCFTTAAIGPNDLLVAIDGQQYTVLSVSVLYRLDGTESHREAYV